ncbi:MAG: transcriptional regulator [Lachnospiraceae bacterium]|nr:transcriptional regulator [Lachnospiraceae bacterium]
MTQKQLAVAAGLPEHNADVRITQYENGSRKPKKALRKALASALDVSPTAIAPPDMGSAAGVMQILFMMEDQYGLTIDVIQSKLCLVFNTHLMDSELFGMLTEWLKLRWEMEDGDQTREDYNIWRYNVPEMIVEDYKHRHVDLPTRD